MSVKIRNYVKGEVLPRELATGFETGSMPEWIWLAERDGKPVAILVVAPAHIVVILMRLLATPGAQGFDVKILLATAMKEIKERGFQAYVTWLNPERAAEAALRSIIQSAGGYVLEEPQILCGGRA